MEISFKNILDTEYTLAMRDWRNQDFVRANMITQDIISDDSHLKYLKLLQENRQTRKAYVAFADAKPFAVVNFTINEEENYVEPGMYIIDKKYLGKGLGQVLSYARLEYIFKFMPEARTTILASNDTNLALQKQFGFKEHHKTMVTDKNGIQREALVLYLSKEI